MKKLAKVLLSLLLFATMANVNSKAINAEEVTAFEIVGNGVIKQSDTEVDIDTFTIDDGTPVSYLVTGDTLTLDGTDYTPVAKTGNKFKGWFLEEDQLGASGTFTDTITAKFESVIASIDVNTDGNVTEFKPNRLVTFTINLKDSENATLDKETYETSVYGKVDILPQLLDSSNNVKESYQPVEFNDGYQFVYQTPSTDGIYTIKFTAVEYGTTTPIIIENNNYTSVTITVNSSSTSVLANDGWPWGTDFEENEEINEKKVTLNVALGSGTLGSCSYQWESSAEQDGKYDPITGETETSLTLTNPTNGTWYRCKVDYDGGPVYSNKVQVLDTATIGSSIAYESRYGGYLKGLYISNGKGAYSINGPHINILGKYNFDGTDYWVQTSFDDAWTLYVTNAGVEKKSQKYDYYYNVKDSSTTLNSGNIKLIKCSFNDYGNGAVIFDVSLDPNSDVALFTDVCLGNYLVTHYSDSAAIKANLAGNKLASIQMLGNENIADADNDTLTFVFSPLDSTKADGSTFNTVDTFDIDSYDFYSENGVVEYFYSDFSSGDDYEYYEGDWTLDDEPDLEDQWHYMPLSSLFEYNKRSNSLYTDNIDEGLEFVRNSNNAVVGMYGDDSVLGVSWKGVKNIRFMMGVSDRQSFGNLITVTDPVNEEPSNPSGPRYAPPVTGVETTNNYSLLKLSSLSLLTIGAYVVIKKKSDNK